MTAGPRGQNKAGMVHRVSYRHFVGPLMQRQIIDHLCSRRDCVFPGHLEIVTAQENARRGRVAKLTEAKVRAIREMADDGLSNVEIAKAFDISKEYVSQIVTYKVWADVK